MRPHGASGGESLARFGGAARLDSAAGFSARAQFIAGCDQSSGGAFVDCECVLSRLEADGYVTLNSLRGLMAQASSEQFSGQPGPARHELATVALACRT